MRLAVKREQQEKRRAQMINVTLIPILNDNYAYLIESDCGAVAVLDPGEAAPVIDVLEGRGLKPDYVLNTHHHWDHVNGNQDIVQKYGAQIVAPQSEAKKIKGAQILLSHRDVFNLGQSQAEIIETPGHTAGGICFYFEQSGVVFTGDTLFSMGCGRLFEGTAHDMYESFSKLKALPDDTIVYCGHEYTLSNAMFCLSYDKDNLALKARAENVKTLRNENIPTLPTTIGLEKATNIFMNAKSAAHFAQLRTLKDNF